MLEYDIVVYSWRMFGIIAAWYMRNTNESTCVVHIYTQFVHKDKNVESTGLMSGVSVY